MPYGDQTRLYLCHNQNQILVPPSKPVDQNEDYKLHEIDVAFSFYYEVVRNYSFSMDVVTGKEVFV